MGLWNWLFGRKKEPTPANPPKAPPVATPSSSGMLAEMLLGPSAGKPSSSGLLADMLLGPLLATVKASTSGIVADEFHIIVVESYFHATTGVAGTNLFGGSSQGPRKLAVMAYEQAGGRLTFRGEDASGSTVDLEKISEPAILYVPRETLDHLKKQPSLWNRVKNPDPEGSPSNHLPSTPSQTGVEPAPGSLASSGIPPTPSPTEEEPAASGSLARSGIPPIPAEEEEEAAAASPFGDAADALEIRAKLIQICCNHNDGSGVKSDALGTLLKGLKRFHVSGPLAVSDLDSLGKLLFLIRVIVSDLAFYEEKPGPGLHELRSATIEAARVLLEKGANATGILVVVDSCFEHSLGYGKIYANRALALFDGLHAEPLVTPFSELPIRDLNVLRARLKRIGSQSGVTKCDGLEQVRDAVSRASVAGLLQTAQSLRTAPDAEQLRTVLVQGCSEFNDGSGDPYPWAVLSVFEKFEVDQVRDALAASTLKSLIRLYSLLRAFCKKMDQLCSGLEQLRLAVLEPLRANLGQLQQVEEIRDLIRAVCVENSDGSGKIFARETQLLFQDFKPTCVAIAMTTSQPHTLNIVRDLLSKIAMKIGDPSIPAMGMLSQLVDEATNRAVLTLRPSLAAAATAGELKKIITDACCEYDDGSGAIFGRCVKTLLEGNDVHTMAKVVKASEAGTRRQLTTVLDRIAKGLGELTCPELNLFRECLTDKSTPARPPEKKRKR